MFPLLNQLFKNNFFDLFLPTSYKPTANFIFISKFMKKFVYFQFFPYLDSHRLFPTQSGFDPSTVLQLPLQNTFSFFRLSRFFFFDTVDHFLHSNNLKNLLASSILVPTGFFSYFSNRSSVVSLNTFYSSLSPLPFGVFHPSYFHSSHF